MGAHFYQLELVLHFIVGVLSLKSFHNDEDLKKLRHRKELYIISNILGDLIKEKCADLLQELDLSENRLLSTRPIKPLIAECKVLKRVNLDKNMVNI